MNSKELLNDTKELNNSQSILRDIIQGDTSLFDRIENLDQNAIKMALSFLMSNEKLSEQDKINLLTDSWRVNFRAKPPTPEEFISRQYLGPAADNTYQRIKDTFLKFMDPSQPYRNLILYPHISWGKSLSPDSKVLTPQGPVQIQDINVHDEVCSPNGKTTKVIAKKYWDDVPLYEFTFSDGRKVKAGSPHLWKAACTCNTKVWDKEKRKYVKTPYPQPCWKIIESKQIFDDIKKNPSHKWFIPLTKPVYYREKTHVIPPYTLGAFLGDGCYGNLSIVNNDVEIFDKIKEQSSNYDFNVKQGSTTKYFGSFRKKEEDAENLFRSELINLNLNEKKCNEKFIPHEYLYDSAGNRVALLQGLMDTDGTVEFSSENALEDNKTPQPSFYTTSEQLAKDVTTLIRGLGGLARTHKIEKGKPSTRNFSSYVVYFSFPNNDFDIFGLERKQQKIDYAYERTNKKKRKPQYLYIKDIKPLDEKGGVCIEIADEDRLFLCEDSIVTHNSYLSTIITLYISTYVSLMRNPWKYFGLNPATQLSQLLVSYSLKKSSELLLEPYMSLLECSPFFEKVNRKESMIELMNEFKEGAPIDKLYYTTAFPTSELGFSSGLTMKLTSNPSGLLGLTIVSIVFSELSFFALAGKALDLNERVKTREGIKTIKDIKIGDEVLTPYGEFSRVENIPWEAEDDLYEIEMEDGRTVKCNLKHLWPVRYTENNIVKEKIVTTQFMLDRDDLDFEILEGFDFC